MHDESIDREQERAFAAFLDRLVTGEPGDASVDPALAGTARDLHDRAAHSTVSAPPASALASIRAELFAEPAAHTRHRAALGIVPFPSLLTRPAAQIALAVAILLALVTGFASFRAGDWLAHGPTSTHSALAASATAPTTRLAMPANSNGTIAFTASGTATLLASPTRAIPAANATCSLPDAQMIKLPIASGQYIKDAWGLGTSPLWLVGLGKLPNWYHPSDPGFVINGTNLPPGAAVPPGERIDLLWLMDPKNTQPVSIRGSEVGNGPDLRFQTGDNPPSREVTFTPAPGAGKGSVHMWWTSLIYTQPGCYEITATWASGSWTIRLPLPSPSATGVPPAACATPVQGTPPVTTHVLSQEPPPYATRQPPIPYITPGIQQIITPPGIPLITPTPFATIIGVATPTGTPELKCG